MMAVFLTVILALAYIAASSTVKLACHDFIVCTPIERRGYAAHTLLGHFDILQYMADMIHDRF